MITELFEAVHVNDQGKDTGNHGKFLVGKFDHEWARPSQVDGYLLLQGRGWDPTVHLFVLDLATGEGAIFRHGGFAKADLDKHKIWVCPLFEPFLAWLYKQDVKDLSKLPKLVRFSPKEVEFQMHGYRRTGP